MKFINHEDPTYPINLDSIDLREQYAKLTDDEKILVFMKLKGFSHRPPTIERLYSDEYYLGGTDFFDGGNNIFDYWKERLTEIFPNEILTAKPFLCLSGAIGIGKSTVSRIAMANTYARLSCMLNPWRTFGLAPKPISFLVMHRDADIADLEFYRWMKENVLLKSPFFKNLPNKHNLKIQIGGPRSAGGLGSDVIFAILSEVNFWPQVDKCIERVNSTMIRVTSRFDVKESLTLAGGIILDSSVKGEAGPTELFLENTEKEFLWHCKASHFEVRPNLYARSGGKTFSVYSGDGKYPISLIPEGKKLEPDQDPGRVVKIPIQLLGEFKADPVKTLQDKCGISTGNSDSFFGGNIQHLINCSTIKNKMPEEIKVDFYDKSDKIIDKVEPMLRLIPYDTPLWLGLDIGVVEDTTGISAVGFDGWDNIGGTRMPRVKCYFTFGLTRMEGQETSIFHIFQFICDLNKRFRVTVSADQAFSRELLQDCVREGIQTNGRISTDLNNDPALYLKSLINHEFIQLPGHLRLQREAYDLQYSGPRRKVDHPKKATTSGLFDNKDGTKPGSKDIWDSLCSATSSLKMSIDAGEEMGYNGGVTKQMEFLGAQLKDAREETGKVIQNMLEGLW